MQHPELSHPKFLLRYLESIGLEPSPGQTVSTRWRREGHNSESRQHRRFEWKALGGKEGKAGKQGTEGKEGKQVVKRGKKGKGGKEGKAGKDDTGKGGKGRKK